MGRSGSYALRHSISPTADLFKITEGRREDGSGLDRYLRCQPEGDGRGARARPPLLSLAVGCRDPRTGAATVVSCHSCKRGNERANGASLPLAPRLRGGDEHYRSARILTYPARWSLDPG